MTTVPCPECGRELRPCNLERHRRAQHMPKADARTWGTKWVPPNGVPISVGRERDRRYDEHVPRGEGPHRFRVYRLRAGELTLTASAPTPECFGLALFTLYEECEYIVDDAVGVLDTLRDPGHWVVHPFALGRRPLREAA